MSIEDIAYDVTEFRFYTVALATLQVYDYLLTLSDEIQYAWKGRKTWVFYLFLVNRYVPIVYQFWSLLSTFWNGYTQEMCNRSAFIHMLICVIFTLLAQVVLTVRIYAITMKHGFIARCFIVAIVLQLGLGVFMTYEAVTDSALPVVHPDFPDGHLCIFVEHQIEEIVYTVFSLLFDVGVFVVIVIRLLWRRPRSVRMSSIVQTIVKDATIYVLLLCTSRIICLFLLVFAKRLAQITRFTGSNVFMSIMVTRMLLSLKRTSAQVPDQDWAVTGRSLESLSTLDLPSTPGVIRGNVRFSDPMHLGNVIPIPMEIIHVKDERHHV